MEAVEVGAMRKTMLAVASHATRFSPGQALSEPHALSALAALAQPTRLAIFQLLIRHEPVGVTAGVIAETIGAPHNTLSSHLAILVRAGLLRSSREGRTITYRADVEGMHWLISFLVHDCCDGHPELCNLLGLATGASCGCSSTRKKASLKSQPKPKARTKRIF
jgi:ArsR family transcriptional regulator